MGQCLPCLGGAAKDAVETPDPEIKRRQLAEAAEKRQMEQEWALTREKPQTKNLWTSANRGSGSASVDAEQASSRGIKNVYSVEQKKKKQEEIEKRMAASRPGGEGGLRWQVG